MMCIERVGWGVEVILPVCGAGGRCAGGVYGKYIKSVVWVILVFMLPSCCAGRRLTGLSADSMRIEIRTHTEYVQDTVFHQIPSIREAVTTHDTVSYLESYYAVSEARINPEGTLFHCLATKPQREPILIDKPIQYRDSIVYRNKVLKQIVSTEKELSGWQKTQIGGCWILFIALVLLLGRRIATTSRLFF